MDELFRVGEKVAQESGGAAGAAGGPAFLGEALAQDPALAELLRNGGDLEDYLRSYEEMLQEGLSGGGPQLDQVDHEGGVTVRPEQGFVVKTKDVNSGAKVFLNVVTSEHVEAPHMKSYEELEGEQGCRVPLSVGTPQEDFDKKGEPCVTYDLVANPAVVEECKLTPAFRETVVQLCLTAVSQKYKIELDPRYKLPKMRYKGQTVQLQRIRKKKMSQIEELPSTPGPPSSPGSRGGEEASPDGPRQPDFAVFYAWPGAAVVDGFAEAWPPPPDCAADAKALPVFNGLDLPCYRVNEFRERIRGTMRKADDSGRGCEEECRPGERETAEMLKGRVCVVQVRLPDLESSVPALKQFRADVSDELLRVHFPMLPRSRRCVHLPLSVWWPQPFCAAEATARWHAASGTLTVELPAEMPQAPAEALAFDAELLDAVF